ncbi:MAG: NAD(P)-binding domain-containing protein [Acidobacteriota bacterium]
MELSKFVIKRLDLDNDDLVIEGDSLTLGSALGNDVLLNHPTVSRSHAGIREIDGTFWIKNLSSSNGTIVNGALIDTVQVQAGDTIQIGTFVLRPTVSDHELTIEIEKQIDMVAAVNRGTQLFGDPRQAAASGKTALLNPDLLRLIQQSQPQPQTPTQPQKQSATQLLGNTRFQRGMTGLLSSIMALPEEEQQRFQQTMDAFWDRRKLAETGGAQKLADKSLLRPREPDPEFKKYNLHLGKKQFNWVPTTDLVRPWPVGFLLTLGSFLIVGAIIAIFVWENVYSPGPVSKPHTLTDVDFASVTPGARLLLAANRTTNNNCASCHTAINSMEAQCTECHKTSHFDPSIFEPHQRANVGCMDCHTEHKGTDFKAATVARSVCFECHRANPTHPKAKRADGSLLGVPHGGTFGYPISDQGEWTWTEPINKKMQIPNAGDLTPKAKFHFVHLAGRKEGRARCTDCHDSFQTEAEAKKIDKNKCAVCHGVTFATGDKAQLDQLATKLNLDCNSCHPQHGESKDLVAALRPQGGKKRAVTSEKDIYQLNSVANSVYRGGKSWQWTSFAARFGGMSFTGWGLFFSIVPLVVIGFLAFDTVQRRRVQKRLKGKAIELEQVDRWEPENVKYAARWESAEQKKRAEASSRSRPVPHPIINNETCIGCHGCILACPQDVLGFDDQEHHAIVVNYEQCMEDTGCQQACPTAPQSCVLINTKKNIREAPKPLRKGSGEGFETEHVDGVYLIGDVSGVPLIRNAIKEGRIAVDKIAEKIQKEGRTPGADYDVAVVGIGPGGIAATARCGELNLSYIALEQGRKYATIADKYPAGKYVAFNPYNPGDPPLGAVKLEGPGDLKETMLGWWDDAVRSLNLKINEFEGCKELVRENNYWVVKTAKGNYKVRKVVLALGNAGEPRKLGVPGEVEGRVEYRLQDPSAYKGKKLVVVGAGNSAVEAAVDLTGKRQPDGTVIFPPSDVANEVSLVVRSDFPKDLTLENKMWVYYCIDQGRIKAYFGVGIKEIRDKEVVLMKIRGEQVIGTIPNDTVFAMVGSIAPKEFLTKVGIKYAGDDKKKDGGGKK